MRPEPFGALAASVSVLLNNADPAVLELVRSLGVSPSNAPALFEQRTRFDARLFESWTRLGKPLALHVRQVLSLLALLVHCACGGHSVLLAFLVQKYPY